MAEDQSVQIHANVNQAGRDCALRLTVTVYGPEGSEEGTRTFRRHVKALQIDGMTWTAAQGAQLLAKMMMDELASGSFVIDELDDPLF